MSKQIDEPFTEPLTEPRGDGAEDPAEWMPEGARPRHKRGVPRWLLWGCGCGCLGLVMILFTMGVGVYMVFKDVNEPEVQWANLGEQLAFETRPTDLTMLMGYRIPKIQFLVEIYPGSAEYHLQDVEDGYTVIVRVVLDDESKQRYMDPVTVIPGISVADGELFTLELQGRDVEAMRFSGSGSDIPFMTDETLEGLDLGPGLRVLLPRTEKNIIVELRNSLVGAEGEQLPLSDEQIADFFEHFQLWP